MTKPLYDVQVALNAAGFNAGVPDGKMGRNTKAALKAFQASRGLVADGLYGPRTEAALFPAACASGHLNRTEFAKWAPNALPGTFEALEAAIAAYPVLAERAVLDDWLGQMWVESAVPGKGGYATLVENLNYSVEGLRETFGRHRISDAECQAYGRAPGRPANQKAIANIVYGGEYGRKNLGNIYPNDGWDFRGSGFKQITGRANTEASGFTAEELRSDVKKAALAAAKFFIDHGCVPLARRGDVVGVTKKVNGGTNGLTERTSKTASARAVIL